jgi:predicted helicase
MNGKDKTTVLCDANITMQNIPLEAYDNVVNGKVDKDSGIENDANHYAT